MLPSGGGIRVLQQFTKGLSDRFDIRLHRPEGGSPQSNGENLPESVYPYPMWRKPTGVLRPTAPLFLIARLLSFKNICRKAAHKINSSADIALIHNTMPIAAPPVLQYLNIPSLYFCYEHPRHIYERDIIHRTNSPLAELLLKPLTAVEKRMDIKSAGASTQIATFSSYMQENIKCFYNRDSAIVRPGVNSDFFCPSPAGNVKENFVLSVGALWAFKGHETIIKILAHIPESVRPSLRIVADREYPGYSQHLRTIAKQLSVDVVIEQGITDEKLRSLYRKAKAVMCCQRNEPYGLVPLEAMACGTPVIAINEGGFPDNIIEGRNGFLFSSDEKTGADILLGIIRNPSSVERTASAGIDFVREKRSVTQGVKRLGEILDAM